MLLMFTPDEAELLAQKLYDADQPDHAESTSDMPMPKRIGSYRVLSLIGAGGMGTVYLAEQQHPRRAVALKILKSGILSLV